MICEKFKLSILCLNFLRLKEILDEAQTFFERPLYVNIPTSLPPVYAKKGLKFTEIIIYIVSFEKTSVQTTIPVLQYFRS